MIKKELLQKQIEAFGFPGVYHQEILKGRPTLTLMGKVKLDRSSGVMTVWSDSGTKKIDMMDPATW